MWFCCIAANFGSADPDPHLRAAAGTASGPAELGSRPCCVPGSGVVHVLASAVQVRAS